MSDFDDKTIRCKRLGHDVPFKYCRTLEGKTVCPSIRDCWWVHMDIDAYLKEHLSEEEFAALLEPVPKPPKLADLIRMAQEVKAHQQPGDE